MFPPILRAFATIFVFVWFTSATILHNNEETTDLIVRDNEEDVSTFSDPVLLALEIAYIAQTAWSLFEWAAGLFGLATSSYGVYKDCVKEYNTTECILSSVGLVTGALVTKYKVSSGFGRVRVRNNNLLTYGTWTDPDEPRLTAEAHIPLDENGRILSPHLQKRDANNGTDWERYVTYYWDDEESQYLLYRQAHATDLGHENDGTFHHFRAEDSDHIKALRRSSDSLNRRLEKRAYGVITDYLWKNNLEAEWNEMHTSIDKNDLARKVTNYLEGKKQGASCLTLLEEGCTRGGCTGYNRINNGVIAYGWDGKYFNFNGRAGGWAEQCKGSNVH